MQQPAQLPHIAVPGALRWLLAVVILGNLIALWTSPWLPMADLGLHVQLLDIAARYNDAAAGYRNWFVQPHAWDSGTLLYWLAKLLRFVDAWTLARVLLSTYVIGLPLALLALARAMERSPWLALFAAPLTWNALVNAGLLDQLVAMPLLLWTVALARTMAARGGGPRGLAVALTLLTLYFCDFVLFSLAGASVIFIILWYRRDIWSLTRLWVLLPVGPLLLMQAWQQLVTAQATAIAQAHARAAPALTLRVPTQMLLARWYDWTLLFFTDHVDYFVAGALLAIWAVLWPLGEYDAAHANRGLLDPKSFERRMFGRRKWTWRRVKQTIADGSLLRGTFDRRRVRWLDVQAWLADHGLEALTVSWFVAYLVLPTQWRGVPVLAELLPVPTLLLLALWPRTDFSGARVWLAAPLVVVALGYSWQVRAEFGQFAEEEVGELPAHLADLPRGARFAYVPWQRESRVTFKGALSHLPTGLVAARHGGLMDDNPATRPQALIRFRKGLAAVQLQADFWRDPALVDVDFVLLRSGTEPQEALQSAVLEHVWRGGHWWLLRVVHGDRARIQAVPVGGVGGEAAYADCPRGGALQGLVVQAGTTALQGVTPLCQTLDDHKPAATPPDAGPSLGYPETSATPSQLVCPRGQFVVALTGRADDYVRALQVQCAAQPWPDAQYGLTPTRMVGAERGRDFDIHCPEGQIAVGIQGRFGDAVDAIALACADRTTW